MDETIGIAFDELRDQARTGQMSKERVRAEPGLPVANPTRSFWMSPPSPIARHRSDLPRHADVVVVGSGITGTAFARTLLDRLRAQGKPLPTVLMLEARDACSGATGRNGGHITPSAYQCFSMFRKDHGDDAAYKITKFRLAHLHELRRVAEEEGILERSQWRQVETINVYFDRDLFEEAKSRVQAYAEAFPSEASFHQVYEAAEALQKYNFANDTIGCIASPAGAIHPYNFVTGILSNLLRRYPNNFLLCTNTPCTSIAGPSTLDPLYTITTPEGPVKTPRVVHATNGWSSQLLPPMRGKIVPCRGNMTAQRPGRSVPAETVQRSFIFFETRIGFDYLTQLSDGEREFMLGASFRQEGSDEGIANANDGGYDRRLCARLGGVLPRYFGEENWGREGQPPEGDAGEWAQGRVKANWSGVLGDSADMLPWVGRLPFSLSGRPAPSHQSMQSEDEVAIPTAPGEWIAAGYTGKGMVHAWMSGRALAEMVMGEGNVAEWFPDAFRVSTDRWMKAS